MTGARFDNLLSSFLAVQSLRSPSERITFGLFKYASLYMLSAMLLMFFGMAFIVLLAAALVATANEADPVTAARRQQVPAAGP